MKKVRVTTNTSGDWFVVGVDGDPVAEGHSISKNDIRDLILALGHEYEEVEISDDLMEEGDFYA